MITRAKKLKKHVKYAVLIISMGLGVNISMGQGCSRFSAAGSSADSASTSTNTTTGTVSYQANTKTVGMVYGKQILSHFTSCLGSGLPSSLTLQTYTSKQGTISTSGTVATLTGPSLMATTSIAGEVCQDLLMTEKNTQRIFIGFNFAAGNVLPGSSQISAAAQRIARSCWARDPDATESQILSDAVTASFPASGATTTHDAALFLCTTMLSSLATIAL